MHPARQRCPACRHRPAHCCCCCCQHCCRPRCCQMRGMAARGALVALHALADVLRSARVLADGSSWHKNERTAHQARGTASSPKMRAAFTTPPCAASAVRGEVEKSKLCLQQLICPFVLPPTIRNMQGSDLQRYGFKTAWAAVNTQPYSADCVYIPSTHTACSSAAISPRRVTGQRFSVEGNTEQANAADTRVKQEPLPKR